MTSGSPDLWGFSDSNGFPVVRVRTGPLLIISPEYVHSHAGLADARAGRANS